MCIECSFNRFSVKPHHYAAPRSQFDHLQILNVETALKRYF